MVRDQMVKGLGCSHEKLGQTSVVLLENQVYLKENVQDDMGHGKPFLMNNSKMYLRCKKRDNQQEIMTLK